MDQNKKYCAFGIGYLDCKGEVIEQSKNFYIVKAEGYGVHNLALPIDDRLTKIFDSEQKRNDWIINQNYSYDER
jgi:hypothetical protein